MAQSDQFTRNLDGKLVLVTGGSGYLGNYVVQALLDHGARVRIASRRPEKSYKLKPLANLGQMQFARCDTTDRRNVDAVMQGVDCAINMVGSFDGDLMKVIAGSAANVAQSAAQAGVAAMVHVSAIGADVNSPAGYAAAKGVAEREVLDAFPDASIIRPPILFGEDDDFVNMFGGMIRMLPALPVFAPHAPLQMLWVDDAAKAIVAALADPAKHGGTIYEIAGPEKITMLEFHHRLAAAQGRKRTFIEMPDAVASTFAKLPLTPMGTDQWLLLKDGNTASGEHPGMKELGLEPHPIGLFLDKWMTRYRKFGRFTGRSSRSS